MCYGKDSTKVVSQSVYTLYGRKILRKGIVMDGKENKYSEVIFGYMETPSYGCLF